MRVHILQTAEFMIMIKIACIALFVFILIFASIALEFPQEMFIYGRF